MATVAKEWREIPGRYNLEGSECGNCGRKYFPKRDMCPHCRRNGFGKMHPYKVSPKGEIFTYSVVHDAPESCGMLKPYAVALVKTDDGLLIAGQVVDVNPEDVKIGMPVRAVLRKLGSDGPAGVLHYGFKFVPDL
ncbi:MAG: Zn-ribbon domain-containing OB-fold protein [Candidatus Methanomethylophilaceae archaeon]|jgi:uncharacterized OB-fold protein